MGYIGKVPADVLIDPHVDSAAITDGTIITADIANDAVTSAKLAENSVDSSELIDGSVDNSHLAGSIAVNKTLLSAGTGLTLSTNTLSVDAAQSQITSVGTLNSLTVSGVASLGNNSKVTSSSADTTFKIETTSGTTIFPVLDFVSSHSSVGAKIRQDGSDVITIDNDQDVTFADDITVSGNASFAGNASITSTVKYFQVMSHTDTSKVTKHGYDGLYTSGSQNQFIQSGQAIKFYPNATLNMQMSAGGSFQVGTGAIGTTNADNWNLVVKSTTGGTISANGGMGYFALGDNYTTSDAILQVRNDGNRGSAKHASGSSLFKASFNDNTAFEITKDGMIRGMQGASARVSGNWEVIDVLSATSDTASLQSDNCFNDNIYSQFKIIIPYINSASGGNTLLFTFMYNSGSGLTEHTGDYYTSSNISRHTNTAHLSTIESNATRATIFGSMHGNTAVGVSGEIMVYDACIADLREYTQFTANTQRYGDGATANDRGSNYRPMLDVNLVGYNTTESAYVSHRAMVRCNTSRHASYWKGFKLQASSGNLDAGSQVIVLGRAV